MTDWILFYFSSQEVGSCREMSVITREFHQKHPDQFQHQHQTPGGNSPENSSRLDLEHKRVCPVVTTTLPQTDLRWCPSCRGTWARGPQPGTDRPAAQSCSSCQCLSLIISVSKPVRVVRSNHSDAFLCLLIVNYFPEKPFQGICVILHNLIAGSQICFITLEQEPSQDQNHL